MACAGDTGVFGTSGSGVFPSSLPEYMDGKKKITIDQLENQLEGAVKDAGIAKEDFTVNNVSAWNNTYNKKKTPDFLASKQYGLRVRDLNKYNQIINKIDPKGIQSTNVDSYDYSKIEDVKRELKVKALLSAKEKAAYLLSAIGDKVGDAISITEIDNGNYVAPRPVMYKMAMSAAAAPSPAESDIDFKNIKLSFQINAVFEIVK